MLARTITVFAPEGDVSKGLGGIQERFLELEIGSYPFWRPQGPGTTIVIRGQEQDRVDEAADALLALATRLGAETQEDFRST
jgi:hypothetical protein